MIPTFDELLLDRLRLEWRQINQGRLRGALRPPLMALGDHVELGRWEARTRTLSLQRRFVREATWGQVIEVLRHEVAHQLAFEVLGAQGERPHGAAFQDACRRLGVGAVASGPVQGVEVEEHPVLRRVRKLMALAASPNRHEAEAAMEKAHRLLREHELDAVGLGAPRAYAFLRVGPLKKRFFAWEKHLGGLLGEHFHVEPIYVHSFDQATLSEGQVLELVGTPDNLAFAAYVHDFLRETGERLWRAHRKASRIATDHDRQTFLAGVMMGFGAKLKESESRCEETGLVWVGDPGLEDAFQARYPRVRTTRSTVRKGAALTAGQQAGRGIVLHKPVESKGSGGGGLLSG
jgi:hypothetical protein